MFRVAGSAASLGADSRASCASPPVHGPLHETPAEQSTDARACHTAQDVQRGDDESVAEPRAVRRLSKRSAAECGEDDVNDVDTPVTPATQDEDRTHDTADTAAMQASAAACRAARPAESVAGSDDGSVGTTATAHTASTAQTPSVFGRKKTRAGRPAGVVGDSKGMCVSTYFAVSCVYNVSCVSQRRWVVEQAS